MAEIFELLPRDDTEDHLWRHGLYVEDAYEVLDLGRYKVFPDRDRTDRVLLIGPDERGRMLTFVITRPNDRGECHIVTGREATRGERTQYGRPGGTRHA